MNRLARTLTVASTLSLVLLLSNCSSFDPTDIMDNMFASQKKPLPRFPESASDPALVAKPCCLLVRKSPVGEVGSRGDADERFHAIGSPQSEVQCDPAAHR